MDFATVAVRFGLYLDLALLFGLPLFSLYALTGDERAGHIGARHARAAAVAAALGLLLSLAGIAVMAKAMTGVSAYAELQAHAFEMIVTGTPFGVAWSVRVLALLACLLALLAWRAQPTGRLLVTTVAGAVALATLAWGGHGAMDEGALHWIHLAVDIVHLWAGGAWLGALFAFVAMASTRAAMQSLALPLLARAANAFAGAGTLIVATLVATGIANYVLIVGPTLAGLLSAAYGQLLLLKLALFVAMLGLAAANRYRHAPMLRAGLASGDHAIATRRLRRSLVLETACGVLILVAVAYLGIQSPQDM